MGARVSPSESRRQRLRRRRSGGLCWSLGQGPGAHFLPKGLPAPFRSILCSARWPPHLLWSFRPTPRPNPLLPFPETSTSPLVARAEVLLPKHNSDLSTSVHAPIQALTIRVSSLTTASATSAAPQPPLRTPRSKGKVPCLKPLGGFALHLQQIPFLAKRP